MLSSDQILETWDRESLRRAPFERANMLPVSPAERKFLVEVGLPDVEQLLLSFDLTAVASVKNPAHLKRIGTDYGTTICIDESQYGCVISFDEDGKLRTRFMNTGVRELATFLTIYKCDWLSQAVGQMPDHEARRRANIIEKKFQSHDPRAVLDPENWWSVILEQMKDGSL